MSKVDIYVYLQTECNCGRDTKPGLDWELWDLLVDETVKIDTKPGLDRELWDLLVDETVKIVPWHKSA